MTKYVVVVGYATEQKDGQVSVVTFDGLQVLIPAKAIVQSHPLDVGKESGKRMFVDPDTTVQVAMKASEVFLPPQGPVRGLTIYKYLDDGGTISKSRDDGGKLPIDDKSPIDDKDPEEDDGRPYRRRR